jgi:hypothetical protein
MFVREGAFNRLANSTYPAIGGSKLLTPDWAVAAAMVQNQKSIDLINQLKIEVFGDMRRASDEPIPVGENPRVAQIPIEVAAEALLGPSSRSIRRMTGSSLLRELLRRLKYKLLRIKRKII